MSDTLSGQPVSVWIATTPDTSFHSSLDKLIYDVAVLGGGIVGVTTAFLLQQEGMRVILIEAEKIVKGVTGNTTAKLTANHSLIYDRLIQSHGQEKAFLYGQANLAGIELVRTLASTYNIDCDLHTQPAYTYTEDEAKVEQIQKEVEAAQSLRLPASFTTTTDLPFPVKGAVRFEDQAQFHPRKYLLALAELFVQNGGRILEQTRAHDIDEGKPCTIETTAGTIQARNVVMATHFPCYDKAMYFARLAQYRSHAYGMLIRGHIPEGMYYSADENGHSFRTQPYQGREMLILGGVEYKSGQGDDNTAQLKELEEYAHSIFDVEEIRYRWATQDVETIDHIPYIGLHAPGSQHVYVATGFAGWGMSNSQAAALLLRDLIAGPMNPWSDLYDPRRFKAGAGLPTAIKENVDVAKHLVGGHISGGESQDEVAVLPAGAGTIIQDGLQKVAVYKDAAGQVYALSAACTHMGCILNFNDAEKSWDCPCHGSRFNYDGKVLQGPAQKDLERKELPRSIQANTHIGE